ncbi:MerR family transcriptional regulator [Nonomuraea sp. NPDC059194]|uniref:helix-turn-helix domain-containing protein n=1 Tax=Nonomuraea sp. NPDC059194 TaxID=3346764 RepID=UPI0036BBFD60
MSETWTIGELARRAAGELRTSGPQANGRVREVPSERLIRWYATIGLLDPPLTRRGRVALYGRRHLLQLVAIKRMQADGSSIAEIQVALTGATDAMLAQAAHLPGLSPSPERVDPPPGGLSAMGPPLAPPSTASRARGSSPSAAPQPGAPLSPASSAAPAPAIAEDLRHDHAVTSPAPPPTGEPSAPPEVHDGLEPASPPTPGDTGRPPSALPHSPATAPFDDPDTGRPSPALQGSPDRTPDTVWLGEETGRPRFWARAPEPGPRSWPVHGVRLAEGVTLLIDGAGRTPSEADLEAVLAAAGPLLTVLEERRLHEGSAT